MLPVWIGALLLLGTSEPEPEPGLPVAEQAESLSASATDGPKEPRQPITALMLELPPRMFRRETSSPRFPTVFVYRTSDGALVETFLTPGTRELEPKPYRMEVQYGSRPKFRVKQQLDLIPGQQMHLRVTARPRILMGIITGVTFVGGLVMTLSGGIRASNRGSSDAGLRWDTRSGVLFGVGLGVTLASIVPLSFAFASPRVRVCRVSSGPSGAFEPCDPS